ncbi:HAMP domain-containing sensor histidine kinase [Sphingobacterium sp. 1.A.5]|uniref:sensor histidine kinase n=1 Tax=Sphingobacterium sp. 1.A.5 TaxID=2044604 RepID=UPI0015D49A2E|nr:HAMP domain-containing sensor histidine kinase [Sphingobacterium sp. 1.A.5]
MNKRPITYILSFLLLFTVLVGMQVYFLVNSYALRQKEIVETVRVKLKDLEDDVDKFDDSYYMKNKTYLELFVALDENKINEDSVRRFYNDRSETVSKKLKKYVDSLFMDLGYQVAVKKELTSIYSNSKNRDLLNKNITIYESSKDKGLENSLTSGTWEMSYSKSTSEKERINEQVNEDEKIISYGFLVSRKTTFIIANLYWILFNELLLFVVASFLILIAILYIFYITYKNLLKQKKQVLVLHDMVDNVSHEMRTPISTMKLASVNLQKKHNDSNFSVLDRQILRLEKLLQPLTDPDVTTEKSDYGLNDINHLLSDLQTAEINGQVNLLSFPEQTIQVNKVLFETIISNLITNSFKYGATQVGLSVELLEDVLQVKVQDNGHGIDTDELPYIFEKFYRVQKDNIHNTKGLGLGLYIVKKVVDQFNGDIKVKSQINKGSEFLIVLPYGK